MAEKRKRGRPIKWESAFEKYKSTALYYTKRAGTLLNDRYIQDISQFKAQVSEYRKKYGWTVAKTTSFLAQGAALNGASLKQIAALQNITDEFEGRHLTFKQAVLAYEKGSVYDKSDVIDLVEANGWDTDAKLAAAVASGEMTISELYIYLKDRIPSAKDRKEWISQNIFGSY